MLSSKAWWALSLQVVLAMLAGLATAYQPAVNARFASHAGSRLHGGAINFIVGAIGMVLVCISFRAGLPSAEGLSRGPIWMWAGGLLGAFFVTVALTLAPIMGTANYLAAMIAGQLLGAAVIDHFGQMGVPVHEFTWGRAVGIVLIFAGVLCVRWL